MVLRYCARFTYIHDAIDFEKQLKGWNRKERSFVAKEDWSEIVRLSNLEVFDKTAFDRLRLTLNFSGFSVILILPVGRQVEMTVLF